MLRYIFLAAMALNACTKEETPVPKEVLAASAPKPVPKTVEFAEFDTVGLQIPLTQETSRRSMRIGDMAVLVLEKHEDKKTLPKKSPTSTVSVYSKQTCSINYRVIWEKGDRAKFERSLYLSHAENFKTSTGLVDTLMKGVEKKKAPRSTYISSSLVREQKTKTDAATAFMLKDLTNTFTAHSPSEKVGPVDILYFMNKERFGFIIDVAMPRKDEVYAIRLEPLTPEKDNGKLTGICQGLDQKEIRLRQ